MKYTEHFDLVMKAMTGSGVLIGTYDAEGNPNIMTAGWGSIGYSWGVPLWNILVRPSRFTYEALEHNGCFTINVPDKSLAFAMGLCGSKSGRDVNKFELCNLTAKKAGNVLAPIVEECPIVYECQVVHSNDILPEKLIEEILNGSYFEGDFHRQYFGKILAAYAVEDAVKLLK